MKGCGTRYYGNITKQKVDAIISELKDNGAMITGDNPWYVDTNQSGVKLRAEWTETTLTLAVTVTDSHWYVPSTKIWKKLDALLDELHEILDGRLRC